MRKGAAVEVKSLVTCQFCGCPSLAWVHSKTGQPYLCSAGIVNVPEGKTFIANRFAFHRCSDWRAKMEPYVAVQQTLAPMPDTKTAARELWTWISDHSDDWFTTQECQDILTFALVIGKSL